MQRRKRLSTLIPSRETTPDGLKGLGKTETSLQYMSWNMQGHAHGLSYVNIYRKIDNKLSYETLGGLPNVMQKSKWHYNKHAFGI